MIQLGKIMLLLAAGVPLMTYCWLLRTLSLSWGHVWIEGRIDQFESVARRVIPRGRIP